MEDRWDTIRSFHCPITGELYIDPVIMEDGHSYERSAITAWITDHNTSPLTGDCLRSLHMLPNHALRCALEELSRNSSAQKSELNVRSSISELEMTIVEWLQSIGLPSEDTIQIDEKLRSLGFLTLEFFLFGDIDKQFLIEVGLKRGYIGHICHQLELMKEKYSSNVNKQKVQTLNKEVNHIKYLESVIYTLNNDIIRLQSVSQNYPVAGIDSNLVNEGNIPSISSFQPTRAAETTVYQTRQAIGRRNTTTGNVNYVTIETQRARSASPTIPIQRLNISSIDTIDMGHAVTANEVSVHTSSSSAINWSPPALTRAIPSWSPPNLTRSLSPWSPPILTRTLGTANTPPPPPPVVNYRMPATADIVVAGFDVHMALANGFVLSEGSTWAKCPYGPKMLVSDRICCPLELSQEIIRRNGNHSPTPSLNSTCIRWRFRATGNSSWHCS